MSRVLKGETYCPQCRCVRGFTAALDSEGTGRKLLGRDLRIVVVKAVAVHGCAHFPTCDRVQAGIEALGPWALEHAKEES